MISVNVEVSPLFAVLVKTLSRLLFKLVLIALYLWMVYVTSLPEYNDCVWWASSTYGLPIDRILRIMSGIRLVVLIAIVAFIYWDWWLSTVTLPYSIAMLSTFTLYWMAFSIIIAMHLLIGADLVQPDIVDTPDSKLLFENYQRLIFN